MSDTKRDEILLQMMRDAGERDAQVVSSLARLTSEIRESKEEATKFREAMTAHTTAMAERNRIEVERQVREDREEATHQDLLVQRQQLQTQKWDSITKFVTETLKSQGITIAIIIVFVVIAAKCGVDIDPGALISPTPVTKSVTDQTPTPTGTTNGTPGQTR